MAAMSISAGRRRYGNVHRPEDVGCFMLAAFSTDGISVDYDKCRYEEPHRNLRKFGGIVHLVDDVD
jgi:hypothetical protein